MSNRIFSEEEVQKLIRRAAELEAERTVTGRGGEKNGLTIDELKKIATETGLDPELIERAASELDAKPPVQGGMVRVNLDEIASEVWLDSRPDRETIDVLITELNHLFGTTDELNWWDNLWGTHEGKAKVKKTSNTTEWNYKTEAGMYSTRVLMQQRDDRFRIRVSKRQMFGMEWDNSLLSLILVIPVAVLLAVIGGSSSYAMFGTGWPGIAAGILLSLTSYPVMRYFSKRSVEKYKAEVKNTVRQLSELVLQSSGLGNRKDSSELAGKSAVKIEITDEPETFESQSGKLRNSLRG
jgi:hypothetical protein